MRLLLPVLLLLLFLPLPALAEDSFAVVYCGLRSDVVTIEVGGNVTLLKLVDPAGACRAEQLEEAVLVACEPSYHGYTVSIVVRGAPTVRVAYGEAQCAWSAANWSAVTQSVRRLEQELSNATSWSYLETLVERVPGGKTTLGLMVLTFAYMVTRSPAVAAAAAILLSPVLPKWLWTSVLAASLTWLLYSLWRRAR